MTELDKYIIACIHQSPTLYGSSSYQEAKMKVLNQLLNVIGNGVNDDEGLIEEMDRKDSKLTMVDIECYVSGKTISYGYTAENMDRQILGEGEDAFEFTFAKGKPEDFYVTSKKEMCLHPEILKWYDSSKHEFVPYPNFKTQYSTIFECPSYLDMDISFLEGALEFYQNCYDWFDNPENKGKYWYEFPMDTEIKTKRRTDDLREILKRGKYKTNKDISEAYDCEFIGSVDNDQDLYDFQVRKWAQRKEEIERFIRMVIGYMINAIKKRSGVCVSDVNGMVNDL